MLIKQRAMSYFITWILKHYIMLHRREMIYRYIPLYTALLPIIQEKLEGKYIIYQKIQGYVKNMYVQT